MDKTKEQLRQEMRAKLAEPLTRRDAIEWILYVLGIRYQNYVASKRKSLEAMTTEQIEREYNYHFGSLFFEPIHFTVIDGEHQLHPLPTQAEIEAARLRCRGPNAKD